MRFWKYGMVRDVFRASAIRRSMSHATNVVEKKPKEWITLRTARKMFMVTWSLSLSTAVIGQGLLEYTRYRDSIDILRTSSLLCLLVDSSRSYLILAFRSC